MKYEYLINPIEFTFHNWVSNNNYHPLDEKRFYTFVNTVWNYYKTEGYKWHNEDKFIKKCLEYKIGMNEAIKRFNELDIIINYKKSNAAIRCKKSKSSNDNNDDTFIASYFLYGKLIQIKISKDEFDKKKIGKKEFLKRYKELNGTL